MRRIERFLPGWDDRHRVARARAAGFMGWALLLTASALAAPAGSAAQTRRLSIESFDARLEVRRDGSLDVLESIRFRFDGSWNGIYRDIPVRYVTPEGLNYTLLLDVVAVLGEDGTPLEHTVRHRGRDVRVKVWVPDARDAERTVTLRYQVANGLRFFDEADEGFEQGRDELFWNVTGSEWEIPIRRASAIVELPEGVTGARAVAFTGAFGERGEDVQIGELEDGFYFETTRPFRPGEGLTIAVGWDPGVVRRPGALTKAARTASANAFFVLPLLSLLLMYTLWKRHGRDPQRGAVVPQYEPPEDLSPGELGTIVDNRVDMRDITATLVDLAVRGHLRIEEVELEGLRGLFGGETYRFHRLSAPGDWADLRPHERRLLEALFDGGDRDSVELDDLKNEFYKEIPKLQAALFDALIAKGHYTSRPDKVLERWLAAGLLSVVAGAFGLALWAQNTGRPVPPAILAGALTGVPVIVFGMLMPRRTRAGARAREHALGLEEFIERVESDRFRRMITGPEMFERLLPFAMALGAERHWARAFRSLYAEPPQWYVSHRPFDTISFSRQLESMASSTAGAMRSAPRSSGGSGFSGGGGVGGGFGGGGGGGF